METPFILFIYLFIYLLAALRGMWDLSSPTRDRTCAPCITIGLPGKSLMETPFKSKGKGYVCICSMYVISKRKLPQATAIVAKMPMA